ncbi:MAG: GAF domain-containing sensor histidine kinase [Pseudomonadota bacterium]
MRKPTYEQLEKRVEDLERLLGRVVDDAMDEEHNELFELSILCNISQALGTTRDLDELLPIVIEEVNKALLIEGSGVLLYDEHADDLYWKVIRDARGILSPHRAELRLPLDGSIAGWVFQNNKPARVNDVSKDPRYYPDMAKKSGFDIRRVLQVPLNTQDKTIGVIMAMNKIGGDFTEMDETLLVSMAASIALAVENATFYHRLKKSRDDLEMIYRSCMALATTMDLDRLLEVVVEELRRAVLTEAAGVLLYDKENGDLFWREIQDERHIISAKAGELRLPLENSVSGRVYQTGEPVMLNDPKTDPSFFADFEARSGFRIRNEIIVPLNTREETIGVLVAINKNNGVFTQEDVHICSSLAGVVAMAVENTMFFEELMRSYRELEDLNRVKTKVLNHLSHELRTPLAIIRGSLATMSKKLKDRGLTEFDRAMARMERHIDSLNRLESQVESIIMTGYSWERRMITSFLDYALTLMELQGERTPEMDNARKVIHKYLDRTFPLRKDEPERIRIRDFGTDMFRFCTEKVEEEKRRIELVFDMENSAEVMIPPHVLHSIMEGLIRNALEATPDMGLVVVSGRTQGKRYVFKVKDTGMGIPDEAKEYIFEGFYPVQETESYKSGRPYSFNAGGKGIDLLRIRMFSELYEFKVSFTTKRCPHLNDSTAPPPGDASACPFCATISDCRDGSGSEFVVEFQLAPPVEV